MKDLRRESRAALILCLLLPLAAFTGCGDDDDDGPTDPGPPEPQDFTEPFAVNQTLPAVSMAIRVLEEIPGYANGVGAKVDDDAFTWNDDDDRWEATTTFDQLGYAWDMDIHVQYLNAGGIPVQDIDDAERMWIDYAGTAHYAAGSVVIHRAHQARLSVINLENAPELPRTVYGGGDYAIDHTRPEGGQTVTTHHEAAWDIGNDGIQLPALGCPLGTVVFDFAPYELQIEFLGTAAANYVLMDAAERPIAEGTGSTTLNCGL